MADDPKIRHREDLLSLEPFEKSTYEKYALTSLTAYSVFWLNEWNLGTTLENVAVTGHRMFPVKFCMVSWPQFPDMNRINRSVLQMRPKYRNLATSLSAKGVFLNPNGIREAKSLIQRIGAPTFRGENKLEVPTESVRAERGRSSRVRSIHPQDLLSAVRKSKLFSDYTKGDVDEAEAIHLIGLLGVYDHTPSSEKKRKLKEFQEAARELNDKEILEFLNWASRQFQKYLDK